MFKKYSLKLVFRTIIALTTIYIYIEHPKELNFHISIITNGLRYIHFLWIVLLIEVLMNLLPRKNILIGCGKQFSFNHSGSNKQISEIDFYKKMNEMNRDAIKVFALWSLVNMFLLLLYVLDYLGDKEMILICILYYVGDMICVVLYCPFQKLIMKNRCCSVCRIYSWDQIFLFTPFLFIRSFFTWSLVFFALIVFIRWEYYYNVYPERFQETTNKLLKCRNCQDKICKIRKPLNKYKKKYKF